MKRKIVAVLLAGGLTLGLCGCGSGGISAEAPAPTPAEDVSVPEETEVAQEPESNETGARGEEPVKPEVTEAEVGSEAEGYSVDELMDMWSSGLLMREEIVEMAAAGEIDSDVFEEFLILADDAQGGNGSGNGNLAGDVDIDELLTTYTIEFEDLDGYRIRETLQVSPVFTEGDLDTMHALWTALGNDIATFPSEESFDVGNDGDVLEYIMGTYMVENLTDGFSITPDNPRSYTGKFVLEEDPSMPGLYGVDTYRSIALSVKSMVSYSNGTVYYNRPSDPRTISDAKMESDVWGPRTFIMALPNISTPNLPDGYRYDKLQFRLYGNHHANGEEYIVFRPNYYSKEVE